MGSKSIQVGSELGNAKFPLGLKLKLTLLGADELNLQRAKPLSSGCAISRIIPLALKKSFISMVQSSSIF